jgi:putative membrane protein
MSRHADEGRPVITAQSSDGQISTELAARRTGMSFQRTRMSADRTLMSVIRTSLSLIGFGFTIFQFFQKLREGGVLAGGSPRNFGLALVCLGVGMLIVGIAYHLQFMLELRRERVEMTKAGLIHGKSTFPTSLTLIVAVLLLIVGLLAILGMAFNVGPFRDAAVAAASTLLPVSQGMHS